MYLPASNEVAGLTEAGTKLLKVNLTSKDTSTVRIVNVDEVQYRELVTDNQSNLYGYKADYSDPVNYIAKLEKINAATGTQTLISNLEIGKIHDNLIYVPQRKEFLSVWDETDLFSLNINTKATNTFPITTQSGLVYYSLISN